MRIDEITFDEYVENKTGICIKCGIGYKKRGRATKYCLICRPNPNKRYNIDFELKDKKIGRDIYFDPREVFIPEKFRGDKWLSGLYIFGKAIIFMAIIDATRDCSKIKNKNMRMYMERIKDDAIYFLSEKHDFKRMAWLQDLFKMSEVDFKEIKRRFQIHDKKLVA